MNNYIYEYYQSIVDGSIIVGSWVRMWYEYIVKGLDEKLFYFSQKKANKAIRFIETFVHHHEGTLAPGLIKLELWQKAMLSVIFGVVDEKGNRQFREIFIVVARKNGKTLFAAGIAEYMSFLDDYGARIYFTAPKLEQANLCFEAFYQSITKEPELSSMVKKRRTDIYIDDNNTTAKPLAFSAKKSDGLNVSLAIADEVASWQGDAGLKFYEVIKSSFGARKQPMLLSISTAGYENEGVYDELFKRGTRVLKGDSKEKRLAPFIYMIDDIEKWNDINELRKSNPNLSVSVSVDYLLDEIAIAEGSLSKKAEFMTKYCNVKQNSSLAWLNTQDVEKSKCWHLDLEMFRGCYCVAGIDLSRTTDLTSCCIVIEKNNTLYCISKFYLPSEKISEASARDEVPYNAFIQKGDMVASGDNFIDYHDCYEWLKSLVTEFQIYPLVVGYDRYSAQYLIQDLNNAGFKTDDVYQGTNLYPVLMEFEGMIKDGSIKTGDNGLLQMHLLNAAIKMDTEQNKGKLVKINPNDHIDGCAALIDALTVRQKYYSQYGGMLKNEDK